MVMEILITAVKKITVITLPLEINANHGTTLTVAMLTQVNHGANSTNNVFHSVLDAAQILLHTVQQLTIVKQFAALLVNNFALY
jgi:hypothetical protein